MRVRICPWLSARYKYRYSPSREGSPTSNRHSEPDHQRYNFALTFRTSATSVLQYVQNFASALHQDRSDQCQVKAINMHATTTFAAIIAAFWCTVSASPVAQNSAPLTLWNGESDMHGMYTSQPIERRSAFAQPDPENLTLWNGERDVQTNHTSSPDLHSRLAPLDVTDCSGSTLCSKLGGATGQCATASRLIDSGNTYSTTGK